MTDKQQPDKFDWATELSDAQGHVTLSKREAKEIGARLRSMGAKLKTYEDLGGAGSDVQILRTGYTAARLEIESLRKERADELAVAYMCGASREQELAAQRPGAALSALFREALAWGMAYGPVIPANQWDEMRESMVKHYTDRASHGQAQSKIEGLTAAQESLGVEFEKVLHDNLWDLYEESAPHGQAPAQPAPAYKDSTPELHVGDSAFESWYSTYSPVHKSDKQRARDAYAAGMGDPLVTTSPADVAGPVVNRATVIEWLDANDIEVTDRQMDGLFHFAAPTTQPAPVAPGESLCNDPRLCCRSHPHEDQSQHCQLREIAAGLRWLASMGRVPSAESMLDRAEKIDSVALAIAAPAAQGDALTQAARDVLAEVERATRKFPTWPTDPLHALAVLGEEFGELTKDMLQLTYEPHKTNAANVRTEALQTAAMALRLFMSLDRYEYRPGAQHSQDAARAAQEGKSCPKE